ncbi:MAG: hypothetical protein M1837_006861 [Sclerophora amabilis]|nr:MAG: hypothetical protein M1837_006861 [Sclerophora amabilis]
MVLQLMSACADEVYRQVLLPVASCCGPKDQDDEDPLSFDGVEKSQEVYDGQADLKPPPRLEPHDERPGSFSTFSIPQWMARSQIFTSKTSSWDASSAKRRTNSMGSIWPVISGPSEFKQVDGFNRRANDFRPLELSICLPSNRLSPLPDFSLPTDEPAELVYPAPAHVASRTTSMLSKSSSEFRIPRKPVGSISGLPTNAIGRESFDIGSSPSTTSSDWIAQPLRPRPSAPGAPSPVAGPLTSNGPPYSPKLRARSRTEPARVLRRRDGEQCLRARKTSPGEWHGLDEKLMNIDTIPEEPRHSNQQREEQDPRSSGASLMPSKLPVTPEILSESPLEVVPCGPQRASTFSDLSSLRHRPLPPTPLNFIQPNPLSHPPPPPPPPKDVPSTQKVASTGLEALQTSLFRRPSISRVTKWLFTSPTELTEKPMEPTLPLSPFQMDPRQTIQEANMSSTLSTISSTETAEESHLPSTVSPMSSPGESPSGRAQILSSPFHIGSRRTPSDPLPMYASCPAYQEIDPHPHEATVKPQVGLAF